MSKSIPNQILVHRWSTLTSFAYIFQLQGLVQDMKDGFTGAMQELARIQSGDQIMRATVEKNRQDCQKGSEELTKELENLKVGTSCLAYLLSLTI